MVRNKITIQRYSTTQDATGAVVRSETPTSSMTKWADAEQRGGGVSQEQGKREWSYDFRFKVRFTTDFIERPSDVVVFNGKEYLIQEVQNEDEGYKRFVILRCSRVE